MAGREAERVFLQRVREASGTQGGTGGRDLRALTEAFRDYDYAPHADYLGVYEVR